MDRAELRKLVHRSRVTDKMLLFEERHKGCCQRSIDELILSGVEKHEGRVSYLADEWDLSRSTLTRWIDQLGLGVEIALIRARFGLLSDRRDKKMRGPLADALREYIDGGE